MFIPGVDATTPSSSTSSAERRGKSSSAHAGNYAADAARLSPGSGRTVRVRAGDSLWKIADRKLGDGTRWREIYELNRDRLSDPSQLQVGQVLRLPGGGGGGGGGQQQSPSSTYTVRPGDTLSLIAQRLLGSPNRWREIYEANRNVISNPNQISVGMVLRIPGRQSDGPSNPPPQQNNDVAVADDEIRRVAMQITNVMETGGLGRYGAINDYDDGVISYGVHQATLTSGALEALLERYLSSSRSEQADALRPYLGRVRRKDRSLRNDNGFKRALRRAANDPKMQAAQDAAIIQSHYNPAVSRANDWNVNSPLGIAMLYDTNIQGGMATCLERARGRVGGRPGQNGVSERRFLRAFNRERRDRLTELAQARGVNTPHGQALLNSRYRCDEFDKLLDAGNLQLTGNLEVRGVDIEGVREEREPAAPSQPGAPQQQFERLERGDEGPKVRRLQRQLVDLRYMTQASMNTGPGIFGPKTEAAVQMFQRDAGLRASGVLNRATWEALKTAEPRPATAGLIVPLSASYRITSRYGMRTHPITGERRLHGGIDLAAPTGTAVNAAGDGTVTRVDWDAGGYGNWIEIAHPDGKRTRYAHLSSVGISNGSSVVQGQRIGAVGSTGGSTGPHLHFEIRVGGSPVNPENYLSF